MTPETNLVTNIGISGTHSNKFYDTLHLKVGKINFKKLKGPNILETDKKFDLDVNNYFNFKNNLIKKIYFKLKYKILKYLKIIKLIMWNIIICTSSFDKKNIEIKLLKGN